MKDYLLKSNPILLSPTQNQAQLKDDNLNNFLQQ